MVDYLRPSSVYGKPIVDSQQSNRWRCYYMDVRRHDPRPARLYIIGAPNFRHQALTAPTVFVQMLKQSIAYVLTCHPDNLPFHLQNPDTTEFLLIGNERQRSKYLSMFPIELYSVKTNRAKSARNLGVIFNKKFIFRSHVSAVCISCFYHMRDLHLRHIRRHLDLDSAEILASALVSIRLDYCNALLYGITDIDLTRLQACTESTGPPGDKVSSIYSQSCTASFPS